MFCKVFEVDNFNCVFFFYKGMVGEVGFLGMLGGNGDVVSN